LNDFNFRQNNDNSIRIKIRPFTLSGADSINVFAFEIGSGYRLQGGSAVA